MTTTTLTSKGQLTLPKPIREYLNLSSGDKIDFIIETNGRVFVSAKTKHLDDIYGMFDKPQRVSVDDMNKAIKRKFQKQ